MSDDDDGTDPFEQLSEDAADRDGDPFEQLDDVPDEPDEADSLGFDENASIPGQESGDSGAGDPTAGSDRPSPEIGSTADESVDESSWIEEHGVDQRPNGPTEGDADRERGDAGEASSTPFDVSKRDAGGDLDPLSGVESRADDPFDEMDETFEEMDVEGIDPDTVWEDLASAESRGSTGDPQSRTYAEVSKHAYCEQCEYFSGPPAIECTHEGTSIIEFLDMVTVRVVDCPVVAERKTLEDHE